MPITICPNCKRNVYYAENSGPDVVHRCDSKIEALDNDSVFKLGNWTDSDGTTGEVSNANLQGMGTIGGLGLNIDSVNVKNERVATHRLRQHHETIEVS